MPLTEGSNEVKTPFLQQSFVGEINAAQTFFIIKKPITVTLNFDYHIIPYYIMMLVQIKWLVKKNPTATIFPYILSGTISQWEVEHCTEKVTQKLF